MTLSWEIVYPLGIAVLFAALIYGAWRYYTRNRANDAVTERAAHELYSHPDTYKDKRAELERQVEPD